MSAITGICECCAISASASASSWLGQATRTMSQPVAVSSAICWSVVLTSEVSVVVIDCTETGRRRCRRRTLPTWIWRVLRRGASTGGGAAGMPRLIAVMASILGRRSRTASCTGTTRSPTISTTPITSRHAGHARRRSAAAWRRRRTRGRAGRAAGRHAAAQRLPQRAGDVAAVERQQRDEVEHADEEVEAGDQHQQEDGLLLDRELLVGRPSRRRPGRRRRCSPGCPGRAPRRRRSPRPTPQTFTGRVPSASTVSSVIPPICSSV